MSLIYDPETNEVYYEGKTVATVKIANGVARVELDLVYECDPEKWILPLSWFAYGLDKLQERRQSGVLVVETGPESIAEEFRVPQSLDEKTVKRGGYVWRFHKEDRDDWPSKLHGHDYEKGLKIDAITGDIYDVRTRQRLKKLKPRDLEVIQKQLRSSEDFSEKTRALIGRP